MEVMEAMEVDSLDVERQKIADGKYLGYFRRWANWGLEKMPQNSNYSLSDLVQEAWVDSFEALDKFDPSYGTKFSTFLYRHIQYCMYCRVRKAWGRRKTPIGLKLFSALEGFDIDNEVTPQGRDESLWNQLSDRSKTVAAKLLAGNINSVVRSVNIGTSYTYLRRKLGISLPDIEDFVVDVRNTFDEEKV